MKSFNVQCDRMRQSPETVFLQVAAVSIEFQKLLYKSPSKVFITFLSDCKDVQKIDVDLCFIRGKSSHRRCSMKKAVLKNFADLKACNFIRKRLQHRCWVLQHTCEYCQIFKNTYFEEHLQNGCFCDSAASLELKKNWIKALLFTFGWEVFLFLSMAFIHKYSFQWILRNSCFLHPEWLLSFLWENILPLSAECKYDS